MNILILADSSADMLFKALARPGLMIHIFSSEELKMLRLSRYCKKYTRLQASEILNPSQETIAKISAYCSQNNIETILPSGMSTTFLLSRIKKEIETKTLKAFPVADLDTLKRLNNKWLFFQLLQENQLPSPKTALIQSLDCLKNFTLNFPLLSKPLERFAGKGIVKLSSYEEAAAHVSKQELAGKLPVVFQEFIPGTDIDLSLLAKDGEIIAWTIQKRLPNRHLIFMENHSLLEMGRKIVEICNYTGLAHFDARIDERNQSLLFLECNPRLWGSVLASKTAGVNFPEIGILVAHHRKIDSISSNLIQIMPFKDFLRKTFLGQVSKKTFWTTVQGYRQYLSDPLPILYRQISKLFPRRKPIRYTP